MCKEDPMSGNKHDHEHPIGTEASKCPSCKKGILFFIDCIGGKSMILECIHCKKKFYKNCGCELFELDEEMLLEMQK
jgi:hypothetical protein